MRVAVSGASGFIGSHLARHLEDEGHEVVRLVRRTPRDAREVAWDPGSGGLAARDLEGTEAVVHLAGEPIGRRWTPSRRRRILESRREGTRLLAHALAELPRPPRVLVCASAVGYYGDRGDEILVESSPPGRGFLADVVRAWEAAAEPARAARIRTVHLRQGIVLGRDGGALRRLLLPFRLGLGGRIGSGRQWWPWIGLGDLLRVYDRALDDENLDGPINAVGPAPATNREFTRTLGRVLGRPVLLPAPALAIKAALGPMGEEALLRSQRVVPRRLEDAAFRFDHPRLESALRAALPRR